MTFSNSSEPTHLYESIEVDGRKLFFSAQGLRSNGEITIVIENGCGCVGAMYSRIQIALAQHFPVITYNRAGVGASDAAQGEADAHAIANDLKRLLDSLEVRGNILLVGHSIGGLFIRAYCKLNRGDVRGMVFLDASHPDEVRKLRLGQSHTDYVVNFFAEIERALLNHKGHPELERLIDMFEDLPGVQRELREAAGHPGSMRAACMEFNAFDSSAAQAAELSTIKDMPLLVLTAGAVHSGLWQGGHSRNVLDRAKIWRGLQSDLKRLSTNSRHLTIVGADHISLVTDLTHAETVSREILSLADSLSRGGE
jgi:pimeloyl-ACP methyl ester carboxylesterase